MPVVSRKAVEDAVAIALTLNCRVAERTLFYRKNYYYPDLSKNFQISQYDKAGGIPIATGGRVQIDDKTVRVRRVQLEEDPGKLTYEGTMERSSYSLVDYNRSGIPLVEIVTEPDIFSPKEAKVFLEKLRTTLESLGISNGELEGAMRCDANVSLGGEGRVEIKNISSFKEVEKALSYEVLRQRTFAGETRPSGSETRHWDERRSITVSSRAKEEEQDYRYFPEPDLVPIVMEQDEIDRIRSRMPELPETTAVRYVEEFGLQPQVARELAGNRELSRFFESTLKNYRRPVELANSIVSELKAHLALRGTLGVTPKGFAELLTLVDQAAITRLQAKNVLREMLETGRNARSIVRAKKLSAVVSKSAIEDILEKVLRERAETLTRARTDRKAFSYLVGQVLKEEPKAEPKIVAKAIAKRLGKLTEAEKGPR